jgi:4-hydroxy-4-methyl-2-oxoglutarate aldolase
VGAAQSGTEPAGAAALVATFAGLSTSVLSDALDEAGIRGVLGGLRAQLPDQGRVAGLAYPVRFARKSGDPAAYRFCGGVGRPLEQVLRTMQAGQMVVFDLDGAQDAACWGGLASRLALRRGVAGTVVWGACRDVDEIRELRYPVWSAATCPRRSRNDFTFGAMGEPVDIAGVTVAPGDVVVGDATGLVCVPAARAAEVLALARQIAASEAEMEAQIASGTVVDWDKV